MRPPQRNRPSHNQGPGMFIIESNNGDGRIFRRIISNEGPGLEGRQHYSPLTNFFNLL